MNRRSRALLILIKDIRSTKRVYPADILREVGMETAALLAYGRQDEYIMPSSNFFVRCWPAKANLCEMIRQCRELEERKN